MWFYLHWILKWYCVSWADIPSVRTNKILIWNIFLEQIITVTQYRLQDKIQNIKRLQSDPSLEMPKEWNETLMVKELERVSLSSIYVYSCTHPHPHAHRAPYHTFPLWELSFKQLHSIVAELTVFPNFSHLFLDSKFFFISFWEQEKKVVHLLLANSLKILSKEANQGRRMKIKYRICIFRVWLLTNNNAFVMQIKPSAKVSGFAYLWEICHVTHQ